MKIYTKTGDNGQTGYIGGRIDKHSVMIDLVGQLDELNAVFGKFLAEKFSLETEITQVLELQQHVIFDLGAMVVQPGMDKAIAQQNVKAIKKLVGRIESEIDQLDAQLQELQNFILPGGTAATANLHYMRTVTRRVERVATAFCSQLQDNTQHFQQVCAAVQQYLNRLSDYLFVLARFSAQQSGEADVPWQKKLAN